MITRIYVNSAAIRANETDGGCRPVIEVVSLINAKLAHGVAILGPCRVVYADEPLSSGARVWIETESEVQLTGREAE